MNSGKYQMKSIITAVLFTMQINLAWAEQSIPPHIFNSQICIETSQLKSTLEGYGEQPVLGGNSMRFHNDPGDLFAVGMLLFINYQTRTWTLVEQAGPDLFCVLAFGQEIQPIQMRPDSPAFK